MLGRGINFGNLLERSAPAWSLEARHFEEVQRAGFNTIRLPVRWSAHAEPDPPYAIDPMYFARVDDAIERASRRDLNAVVNMHFYPELLEAPGAHSARYLGLWRQIAARYAGASDHLAFELLNEPDKPLAADQWNALWLAALEVVRASNPRRRVIVGPTRANTLEGLASLELPRDDRLVVTIHYYAPFEFTHQGASWVPGADRWRARTWGQQSEIEAVHTELAIAAAWARAHACPLFIGEFGAYEAADMASRERWTTCVRSIAAELGLSWAYWDFASDFGAFDVHDHSWRAPLKRALMGS